MAASEEGNARTHPWARLSSVSIVSSPGDVAAERARAEAVGEKLNAEFKDRARFDAVFWEDHFYSADKTFQDQIPEAAECHLALAIFRARLGSPLAGSVAVVGALAIGMGAAVTMFGTCSSSAQHKRLSFGRSTTPKANWYWLLAERSPVFRSES